MSGWEKFLSITTGITMAIPMMTSGIKSLGTVTQWLNRHETASTQIR
jgi:hypothetical protein